ncbi:hypothetical protein [Facilibium subflavum]|uniref:hypothetical protein n=1 Tax=Facilibium subflavum TaxID=2219058 RepID=UPI000E65753C|nr:hypothetical protein [Facilibium subflavum]
MDYDLIIAINFSKFNESNFENDVFKFVKATALDEFDLKAFEYKHQNLVQEDPYIGIYQYTKNDKAFPLRRFDDKVCQNQIPVINLTCPLQGEFFQQYLALLQSSINKLKAIQDIKSAKIYICGHGKDINSLGTGDDKLNNGCVIYECAKQS